MSHMRVNDKQLQTENHEMLPDCHVCFRNPSLKYFNSTLDIGFFFQVLRTRRTPFYALVIQ